jgi:lipid-A-disaccharide synthase-like uncharacterized protein
MNDFFQSANTAQTLWLAIGFFGQALFSVRLLWQWIASERGKRCVVPTIFWWLSLGGASMLLAYFIWRRDPVGILGQGFGWIIYARNLALIRAENLRQTPSESNLEARQDPSTQESPHFS